MSRATPQRSLILTEDMKRVMSEQRLGFVATVCPDGTPSLSPKGTTVVWDDEHLVSADIRSPGTVENLRANKAVEVNVVDPIARKGYRFKGEATVLTEGALFEQILASCENGAAPVQDARSRIRSLVLVKVERASRLIHRPATWAGPRKRSGLSGGRTMPGWPTGHREPPPGITAPAARFPNDLQPAASRRLLA